MASVSPTKEGIYYAELVFRNAFRGMHMSVPFAADRSKDKFIHLRDSQIIGDKERSNVRYSSSLEFPTTSTQHWGPLT